MESSERGTADTLSLSKGKCDPAQLLEMKGREAGLVKPLNLVTKQGRISSALSFPQ